jgi:hypothetical protein
MSDGVNAAAAERRDYWNELYARTVMGTR